MINFHVSWVVDSLGTISSSNNFHKYVWEIGSVGYIFMINFAINKRQKHIYGVCRTSPQHMFHKYLEAKLNKLINY